MDRFTSYSGNGYEERKSQEYRSLNNRVGYFKQQKKLEKEEQERIRKEMHPTIHDRVENIQHTHTQSLAQNHLKLPGNNQFK